MSQKVPLNRVATGVPGLDAILGGGLPEFSFTLIAGSPGSGKTTLAHQIMFSLATRERPALFFTVLGEPPLKMLRYQQQFSFFNFSKIDESIYFINLSEEVSTGKFDQVLARITAEVEAAAPGVVFVDSFRSIMRDERCTAEGTIGAQQFIQELGILLASWQATSFLVGESMREDDPHPIFTVADGVLALTQNIQRNSVVRKMQVLKMRGQATLPGMHIFRLTKDGVEVYPTALIREEGGLATGNAKPPRRQVRLPTGVPGLDDMLGGGLPSGYSLLVAGPSGSGKTILATAFLAEGVRRGEPGVMVAFEQAPSQSWPPTIDDLARAGSIGLINTRSLDLSIDEIVQQLVDTIRRMKATRVVIDSLSGFELAVAPTFREDFRESLFRMVAVLSGLGVSVLMTSELEDRYTDLRFSPYGSAFLTDAIIVERYIEIGSCLKRVMAVVKVRGSDHSKEIRQYEIINNEIVIGEPMLGFEGLLSAQPMRANPANGTSDAGRSG
jgi:circadian clock protein KaiC